LPDRIVYASSGVTQTFEFGSTISEGWSRIPILFFKQAMVDIFVTSIFERDRVCLIRSSHICQ
jgi:hypothetical protein